MWLQIVLGALGCTSLVSWLTIVALPSRPWDLQPVGEDDPPPADPARWPSACVIVPARNESAYLPRTLPALLAQDYPGDWRVVVVDDRSLDDTAVVAAGLANDRVIVVRGRPLPEHWVGKVWAMAQGTEAAGETEYLLLADADIRLASHLLRRLVAESEAAGLALNSRMARLRTISAAERLLVPPFLFFFNLLYPMRRVNGRGLTAAAAGGCILLRRAALQRLGGFTAIREQIIDDVHLAGATKRLGMRIRLATSRGDVTSLREYGTIGALWRSVRRTAFDELGYSPVVLLGTVAGLVVLFLVPPGLVLTGLVGAPLAGTLWLTLGLVGALAWATMALVFLPTVRFFGLRRTWAMTFPLAGLVYAAITVDSALRHVAGRGGTW
jgi:hopene-associated glycosyltransferase HpnB